jgi:hypothetical protein
MGGKGGGSHKGRVIEGVNIIKVHYVHAQRCHDEIILLYSNFKNPI